MSSRPKPDDKRRRHRAILDVVEDETIRTQEGLVEQLAARGLHATQSTISRDVRELGLVRVPGPDGSYRYARPGRVVPLGERQIRILRQFVDQVAGSGSMAMLKTEPGNAHPVGLALDRLELDPVVGTVAGDDTVLVLLREDTSWQQFRDRLEEMLS